MLLLLLIIIPLITGIISFAWKNNSVKGWAFFSTLASLIIAAVAFCAQKHGLLTFDLPWIPSLGARFSLDAGGMATLLALLTAIVYLIIFITQWNKPIEEINRFVGLMLLSQAGITGVFLANDLLLFYFFWELALVPVYFLASTWGGEKRVQVTFKFFIYTFLGSMLMLAAVIYLYLHTESLTFDYQSIIAAGQSLDFTKQQVLFWFIFAAFAVKMPIFPFHTWQPDTYEQASIPVTIVLSAVMVKMGLFATFKWLIPVLPQGVDFWSNTVMILCIIGIIYASILAFVQTDLKRLVAYSSIAHVGLMCLALFAQTDAGNNGVLIQMFNHGINITGMWILIGMIEHRYQTRDMRELGGIAAVAPTMVISLVIIAFANIALPLTNAFVGEFMLLHGIFQSANPHHILYMVLAGTGIIMGAVYTLNMVQKVAYGDLKNTTSASDVKANELIGLIIIIAIIIIVGVYPDIVFSMIG